MYTLNTLKERYIIYWFFEENFLILLCNEKNCAISIFCVKFSAYHEKISSWKYKLCIMSLTIFPLNLILFVKWKWMYMYKCRWMWKIIPLWTPLFVDIGGIQVQHGKHLIYNWRSTLLKLTGIRKEFSIHLYLFTFYHFFLISWLCIQDDVSFSQVKQPYEINLSHTCLISQITLCFFLILNIKVYLNWKKKEKYQRKNNNILIFFKSQFIWDI